MNTIHVAALLVPLVAVAATARPAVAPVAVSDERITIEYSATDGEATVIFETESSAPIAALVWRDPAQRAVAELRQTRGPGLESLRVESIPASLPRLFADYPAGDYSVICRDTNGGTGSARTRLSHDLLRHALVRHPAAGAVGVATDLEVVWEPVAGARGYEIVLEQGDTDGLLVELPASVSSFRVPAGVLRPNTPSHVEVGVIAPSGNRTMIEVPFTTR